MNSKVTHVYCAFFSRKDLKLDHVSTRMATMPNGKNIGELEHLIRNFTLLKYKNILYWRHFALKI